MDTKESVMKPISLQLYTLRDRSEKDFPGVIKAVGDMGYCGVEPAGFYGLSPAELRRIVEDNGMVVSSSHGPWASPENLPEVIDTAAALGVELVSSGFGPEDFATKDAIKRTAERVNGMAATLAEAGLTLFLHNHYWEFEMLDGRLKYDLFAELAPTVSFEIDTYWAANFGANDPVAIVKKFAPRAPLLHIKDGPLTKDQPMLAVGKGKMPTRKVIEAADAAVLRWLVVELDACATDMLQAVRDSYDWLTREGLARGRG
jgi:sugar phosphate isomerase/epimerase